MEDLYFLQDKDFLKALDNDINKNFLVKIEVLNSEEIPIKSIEGKIQPGCVININGTSSVRRTCNINFIALEEGNDLTDINNLLSANKKIRILEGIKNNITSKYDEYIWFPLGIFVITQPNITHNATGCFIQLSCKDKMCLLNGECAGMLPASVIFSEYEQAVMTVKCDEDPTTNASLEPNNYSVYYFNGKYYSWTMEYGWKEEPEPSISGETTLVFQQKIYDIIQTLVHFYGGISLNKIFINDVPLQIKQYIRYTGSQTLWYNTATKRYTTNQEEPSRNGGNIKGRWRDFHYDDDIGYVYTDFIYPGKEKTPLVSSIGDNICTILDKIKNTLGNYEYFFDIEGNFIFQEKKNYLNTSYDPSTYRLDNGTEVYNYKNNLSIIDITNYKVDFYRNTKSVYTFKEGSSLITSFVNTPNYTNLRNDFHIWGEIEDGNPIHYHLAIKKKPSMDDGKVYHVVFLKDDKGNYTGKLRLASIAKFTNPVTWEKNAEEYIPSDWRAKLYLEGLEIQQKGQRPDIYQQELLDLFDDIYDFRKKEFKTDLVFHPNSLKYFFDYLEPVDDKYDCSVDVLGSKIYTYAQEKMTKLYEPDVPDNIILDITMDAGALNRLREKCANEGQSISQVNHNIFSQLEEGTTGYVAQEVSRELLYQYTNYNEVINIQSIPIYYLDVNTRITVEDAKSGIYGDYIINSISLPLNAGNVMTINASRALERI